MSATITQPAQPATLLDVIKIIPADCYDNPTAYGMKYVVRSFVVYFAIVAAIVSTDKWWILIPMIGLAGLTVAGLFVIGHDASHGALFASTKLNRQVARLAMLPSMHIEAAWDLGHNRIHHGHTVKQGMDFVWHPVTKQQWDEMPTWQRIRHRVEWSVIGPGFYYGRQVWWTNMIRFVGSDKLSKKINKDRAWMFSVLTGIAVIIGAIGWVKYGSVIGVVWMLLKVAIIPWMLFTSLIGFTVYVHHIAPDIRWYPRGEWTKFRGQMEGTTILHIPKWLNFFWHNIFIHAPHHVDMRIPFYKLPSAAAAIDAAFPGVVITKKFSFFEHLRNTRQCKLYDFESGQWSKLPA